MNPVYFLGWCFFRALYKFYFGWRVYNPERVPLDGPVRVFGTFQAFGRHMGFPRPRRRGAVKYGEPMRFEELRAEAKGCPKAHLKESYQQVANEIMAAIEKLEAREDK